MAIEGLEGELGGLDEHGLCGEAHRLGGVGRQRRVEVESLVGTGLVVQDAIALALVVQLHAVADLQSIEVLVLERAVVSLDDAVGLGRPVAGPDVGQPGAGGDETGSKLACIAGRRAKSSRNPGGWKSASSYSSCGWSDFSSGLASSA